VAILILLDLVKGKDIDHFDFGGRLPGNFYLDEIGLAFIA